MKPSRRTFLKKSALTLASLSLVPDSLFAARKASPITGVQLYSIREEMKLDAMGTLKKLADIGYKHVEHANYINRKFYGWSAKEFRKVLDDLGLKMPSGHTVFGKQHWDETKKDFTDIWRYTVEDAAVLGQTFVISPSLDRIYLQSADVLKSFMEVFNKNGELCKKSGMKFGYHNHDFEFSLKFDGVTAFDIILNNTDPALVTQQLDIGNLYDGGAVALDVVKKYPGRFESMHVKDEIKATSGNHTYESTILGKGIVPVKEVIDLGRKNGTIHFIIEQESYQGKPPLECVKEDLDMMKKWGY